MKKLNREHSEQKHAAAYQAAIDFLYSRINYEKGHVLYSAANYRLDRMRRLLDLIGNPQERYQIVHVAGTKGKGSTANAIACLLDTCGFRIGLYTSPHLLRLEERIQCIGRDCTASELVDLVDCMRPATEVLEREGSGRPTFFELTTAMGMLHFAKVGCDFVVLEVGLGGRLDSTNVCQPVACVITSISFDHQAQLGHTIASIAAEKAGIIKPAVPVVCTARNFEARQVITRSAAELASPLYLIDRDFSVEWRPMVGAPGMPTDYAQARAEMDYRTSIKNTRLGDSRWRWTLLGRHQADNLAGALTVVDVLAGKKLPQPLAAKSKLQAAVLRLKVSARLQIVGQTPIQIIDTAHNPASMYATLDALDSHFPDTPRTIVFASSRDKDFADMLRILLTRCQRLILTAYQNNVRGLPLTELEAAARDIAAQLSISNCGCRCAHISIAPNAREAWQLATRLSSPHEIICGTGSFFLAAELLAIHASVMS